MKVEPNTLHHGDCLEVMKGIADASVDMILCDLPYGHGITACKWDCLIPLDLMWEQYKRIIKLNGVIVLTASQPFTSNLVMSNLKMFKYELIWNKMIGGAFVLAKKRPLPSHESILIFYKKPPVYNPQMTEAIKKNIRPKNSGSSSSEAIPVAGGIAKSEDKYDSSKRYPVSIYNISSKTAECNSLNRIHPTQKPLKLFEYLIKTYTNPNDLVLDNCAGSGTTGAACLNLNRRFILIEKEAEYIKVIEDRLGIKKTSELKKRFVVKRIKRKSL